jgi:hypothetical protein
MPRSMRLGHASCLRRRCCESEIGAGKACATRMLRDGFTLGARTVDPQ